MFRCRQRLGGGLGAVESTLECLECLAGTESVPSHVECGGTAIPSLAVHMASPPAGKGLRAWHSSKQQKSMMQSR